MVKARSKKRVVKRELRLKVFCAFRCVRLSLYSGLWAYHRHFGLNEREWMETLDLINLASAEVARRGCCCEYCPKLSSYCGQRMIGPWLMHPSYHSQVLLNWLEDVMASKIGLFNLLLILLGALVVTTTSQTCPSICTCKWKNGKIFSIKFTIQTFELHLTTSEYVGLH